MCLQGLPVVFAVDRAGAVGEDSPTQQGAFDLSFLRVIPGVTILVPRDDLDLAVMLRWALAHPGPVAVRYARCKAAAIWGEGVQHETRDAAHGQILREGTDATMLGVGPILASCLKAAGELEGEGLSVGVADARRVKPLDADLLDRLKGRPIITVEENAVKGGFGSAVLEHFEQEGVLEEVRVRSKGFPDAFIDHATRDEQLAALSLDASGIARTVREFLHQQARVGK